MINLIRPIILISMLCGNANAASYSLRTYSPSTSIATNKVTPSQLAVASSYATARFTVETCQLTDGAVINGAYWQKQIDLMGGRTLDFDRAVRSEYMRTRTELSHRIVTEGISGWCDDQLDFYVDTFSAGINPFNNNWANLSPICWNDPTGLYGCPGIGLADPFAFLDE